MPITYSTDRTTVTFSGTGELSGATADLSGATIAIIEGYTTIGDGAFKNASGLTSITIPEGVTSIGESAFQNATSLTSVNIPASVTTFVNGDTFQGCSKLQSITVDQNNENYSSSLDGVLFNKSQTVLVSFPGGKTGSYIIPESVNSIFDWAFAEVRLSSVTILSSVTSIGAYAFYGEKILTSITVVKNNENYSSSLDGVLFNKSQTVLVSFPGGKTGSYIIPESVNSIFEWAFAEVRLLSSVTIPASVTSIGDGAFYDATGLTSVTFEADSKLTSIGDYAFNAASFLTSITIPASVKTIEEYAFSDATSLTTVYITNGQTISGTTFSSSVAGVTGVSFFGKTVTTKTLASAPPVPPVPICFPAGTPVTTDQGFVPIEKLNPDIHTINGKKIIAITQTRPLFKEIVSIKKNAFSENVPSQDTEISNHHMVSYQDTMIKARELVELCEGVKFIPYNGETLYNVLLKKYSVMIINNMVCETLHPDNIMAQICGGMFNKEEKNTLLNTLTGVSKKRDIIAYNKILAIVDRINHYRKTQNNAKKNRRLIYSKRVNT